MVCRQQLQQPAGIFIFTVDLSITSIEHFNPQRLIDKKDRFEAFYGKVDINLLLDLIFKPPFV